MAHAKQEGTLAIPRNLTKNRQVISNKFLKNFRSARDLVVFDEFLGFFFGTFKKSPSTTKSRAPLKLFGTLLEIT